jgi:hypothetical protein
MLRLVAVVALSLCACEPVTDSPPTGGGAAGGMIGVMGGGSAGAGGAGGGSMGMPTNTSGFRTNPHGFSFENYGNDGVTNLTPVEMRRMFGDGACASVMGGTCTLTPAAASWMTQANAMMNGGHCFGFSHLALGLFNTTIPIAPLGGATTFSLQKANPLVQREIAYWMATQLTEPGNRSVVNQAARPTPTQFLTDLAALWGRNELATVAIFNRMGGGGHAVTPHSIRTRMDGKQELVVYDNNFPDTDRVILVDPAANSWTYSASINPSQPESQYDGDATTKSLFFVPLKDAQLPQQCPFCGDANPAMAMTAARTVGTAGGGDLVVEDDMGNRVGSMGRTTFNTFPGAVVNQPLSAELYRDDSEPQYVVPGGRPLRVTIDGASLSAGVQTGASVVGPGYSLSVQDVDLAVGERDVLEVSAAGDEVVYTTQTMETATVSNSFSTSGADFDVSARVASDANGAVFSVERTGTVVQVRFVGAGATQYGLVISRLETAAVQSFLHAGESLAGDTTLRFDVAMWPGQGQGLSVEVDEGSDGTVERTVTLSDQN